VLNGPYPECIKEFPQTVYDSGLYNNFAIGRVVNIAYDHTGTIYSYKFELIDHGNMTGDYSIYSKQQKKRNKNKKELIIGDIIPCIMCIYKYHNIYGVPAIENTSVYIGQYKDYEEKYMEQYQRKMFGRWYDYIITVDKVCWAKRRYAVVAMNL
jgi:hypothetical protein